MREQEIYIEAMSRPNSADRRQYLDNACDNAALRERVEKLIRHSDQVGSFLEEPAVSMSTNIMPNEQQLIGTMIGPYKLREQIGEGGMGVVYVAEQMKPVKRKVALKIIKPGMDTKDVIARFEAERQALAMMDHPNIAKVLGAGATESGRPYFVMELVNGIPITEYCEKAKLTNKQRLGLFIKVCKAIQHAHQKGIIHRDIKPSNVLITMMEDGPEPKVIDFGIAKAINQQLTQQSFYTAHAQMIGTPLYMSPEQAERAGFDVDTRSDVYSLGVLLYELLTGSTPFDKEMIKQVGFDEMRRMIREVEPQRPSARISTLNTKQLTTLRHQRDIDSRKSFHALSSELDWIVMKALEKDRTRRYESANGLARDVERHLNNEPVEACPPSTVYRFKKLVRRNRVLLTTTTLVAVALLVGTGVSLWQAKEANDARELADRRFAEASRVRKRLEQKTSELEQKSSEAQISADEARQNAIYSGQLLYAADMKLAFQAWKNGDIRSSTELLDQYQLRPAKTDPRGFEWWYLRGMETAAHQSLAEGDLEFSVVRYSRDGNYIGAGGTNGTLHIWDAKTNRQVMELHGHTGMIRGIDFSRNRKLLASIGDDRHIRLWDLNTGQNVASFEACEGYGYRVFFGLDDTILVSSSEDSTVKVWDVASRQVVSEFQGFSSRRHDAVKSRIDCSPDGRFCAIADKEKTRRNFVRVYDLVT